MSFLEPMEKGRKKKKKDKKNGLLALGTVTFCEFYHVYKADISQMTGATAEAMLQGSW